MTLLNKQTALKKKKERRKARKGGAGRGLLVHPDQSAMQMMHLHAIR